MQYFPHLSLSTLALLDISTKRFGAVRNLRAWSGFSLPANQNPKSSLQRIKPRKAGLSRLVYRISLLSLVLTFSFCLRAMGGAAPEPGNSHAFGHSLADWQDIYFRWFDDATLIAPDANGNAVAEHHVVLLALPDVSGDGTPGVENLTLSTGQPFVLPLWVLQGNSYVDGSEDDLINIKVFKTLEITVKVDGQTVITNSNVMDYYSEFYYNPAIKCPPVPGLSFCPPSANAVIWFQGIGMVHGPFSPGEHTITLDAFNTDTEDLFGLVFAYHNTWNVTVKAGK